MIAVYDYYSSPIIIHMYMQSRKPNSNLFLRIVLLAIVSTTLSYRALAQAAAASDSSDNIAVRFLGSREDMILVGVKYTHATEGKCILSIYNNDGDVVFRNAYQSGTLDKKFQIPKEHGKLTFVFSGVKEKRSKSYVIYNTSKVVEDVIVRRIGTSGTSD
jgi:hypothetical protein